MLSFLTALAVHDEILWYSDNRLASALMVSSNLMMQQTRLHIGNAGS